MILIGGAALQIHKGARNLGELKPGTDLDIVCTEKEFASISSEGRIDHHNIADLNNNEIESRFRSDKWARIGDFDVNVCSLAGLAAIKRSHLWRDYFFDKHIAVYHYELVKHARKEDADFVRERTRLTHLKYPRSNPNLMQPNEDFFDDAVEKAYDHDWLHEIVAFGQHPIYMELKYDDSLAWCERELWEKLTFERKLQCVAEETYVIAIERIMVPNGWYHSPKGAFSQALRKVCTTLTSGWFRDFAIDNHPRIMQLYDRNKMKQAKERIMNEQVL